MEIRRPKRVEERVNNRGLDAVNSSLGNLYSGVNRW